MEKQAVKKFVRQTLGCTCPDAVFNYVECEESTRLSAAILLSYRINIGHRLLIYVVKTNHPHFIDRYLSTLVRLGKDERDRMGFNRFRLVIATDKVQEIGPSVDKIFKDLEDRDDKINVHVVSIGEVWI